MTATKTAVDASSFKVPEYIKKNCVYVLKSFALENPGRGALNPGFYVKIAHGATSMSIATRRRYVRQHVASPVIFRVDVTFSTGWARTPLKLTILKKMPLGFNSAYL